MEMSKKRKEQQQGDLVELGKSAWRKQRKQKDEPWKQCCGQNPEKKKTCFRFLIRNDLDEQGIAETQKNEKHE